MIYAASSVYVIIINKNLIWSNYNMKQIIETLYIMWYAFYENVSILDIGIIL